VSESLEEFLSRVASNAPTPGGGTVSAVCGALSASLCRMVANLAVGKQGYEAVQPDLAAIEETGKALQARFLALADADAAAYESVVAAMRLPKGTDAEKGVRKAAIQGAYRRATDVPLDTMRAGVDALELARLAAERGNRNAITDAGVAGLLAHAAVRGAALNVRINLAAIADAAWREDRERALGEILERSADLAQDVERLVDARM